MLTPQHYDVSSTDHRRIQIVITNWGITLLESNMNDVIINQLPKRLHPLYFWHYA